MSQVTPDQLKALLAYASKRLGTTPEQLEKPLPKEICLPWRAGSTPKTPPS